MAEPEVYEAIILGGGKAGKTLAMDLAKGGRKTAMVERGMIGGSCINVACIPTKTFVKSAKVAETLKHATTFGLDAVASHAEMAEVRRRKREVVAGMVAMNQKAFDASGMDLIVGEGRFVGPKTVEVALADGGTRLLTAKQIFINTGSRAAVPDVPGMAAARPMTHVSALELDRTPEHLIVLGGGYIGMEMGQAFRRLGSRVTIVERNPQLAPREDPDVAEAVANIFQEEGIELLVSTKVLVAQGRSGDRVRLVVEGPDGETTIEGTDVLASTGRIPNSDNLGLDAAGVETTDWGYIRVNERLETTAPDIWALGDVAGSPQFTHVALDDYRVVKANLSGKIRTTTGRLIPYCVFIDPELARVGINEADARRQGLEVRVAKLPTAMVPRARTIGETRGFLKAIVDAKTDRILGFTMLGAEAGEVVSTVQMAMLADLPYTALRDGILAHPTMTEGLNVLFSTAFS